MQTVQCVKKVCETVCRQIPCTTTVCDPVTTTRRVTECKMVCVPRTITKCVPVEICTKVPVVVHCPTEVLPSAQSVLATSQISTVVPMDVADRRHPLLGRLFR
jgi:hypothetical protein